MSIKFSKIRKVRTPTKSTGLKSGLNFYIPVFTETYKKEIIKINESICMDFSKNEIILKPKNRIIIPSGICVELPENYIFVAMNNTILAKNEGLDKLAEVVDFEHKGEINIVIHNTSNNYVCLKENLEIIQFILIPNISEDFKEVPLEEIYEISKLN